MIEFATFLVLKPLFGIPLLDNLASAMGTVMGGHGHGGGASYGGGVSSGYGAPSGGYGAPSDGYGAPSDGYGAPSDGYGAPSGDSGYNPGTDYAAPADSYHGRRRRGAALSPEQRAVYGDLVSRAEAAPAPPPALLAPLASSLGSQQPHSLPLLH